MKLCSPYPADAPLGRIDAGIDYARPYHGPLLAIADCTVTDVVPTGPGHSWGGMGRVKFRLTQPITVKGRTYREWYSAEAGLYYGVIGDRVTAGQAIGYTKTGWQETGFVGSQSFNEQAPTQEGRDFLTFVKWCVAVKKPVWHPLHWWARRPGFRPF